jgi:putative Mg2+ transporter-C (MgtC) family protein
MLLSAAGMSLLLSLAMRAALMARCGAGDKEVEEFAQRQHLTERSSGDYAAMWCRASVSGAERLRGGGHLVARRPGRDRPSHGVSQSGPSLRALKSIAATKSLGAGVIFKEGLAARGLTTAAFIWLTASVGILVGIGLWLPAIAGAAASLIVLSAFRLVEARLPSEFYAHIHVRFRREAVRHEPDVRALLASQGFSIANMHARLIGGGQAFEYRMVIKSRDRQSAQALSRELPGLAEVVEFRISPTGD